MQAQDLEQGIQPSRLVLPPTKLVTLRTRKPLRSVTPRSSPGGAMQALIDLHFRRDPRGIVDLAIARGVMWRGCRYKPTLRLDKRPLPGVDLVVRWQDVPAMPELRAVAEVCAVDPPHQAGGGERALGGDWADRYGTADTELRGKLNINDLFAPILAAARHVLEPSHGLLLVKMADQSRSGGHLQLQSVDFVNAARAGGWDVCHLQPLWTSAKPDDRRWMHQRVLRKEYHYWIALHPARCRSDGIVRSAICPHCPDHYAPKRKDQRTCGKPNCRKRRSRARSIA